MISEERGIDVGRGLLRLRGRERLLWDLDVDGWLAFMKEPLGQFARLG